MSQDFELDDLSMSGKLKAPDQTNVKPDVEGTISTWTWTSSILLSVVSLVLIISPRFLLFIVGETRTKPTPLEAFLALHFGIFLFSIVISLLLNIPSSDPLSPKTAQLHRHPLLVPLTGAGLLMSFLSYNTANVGSMSLLFAMITGTIGLWGLWSIVFSDCSSISKKTGANKHTSAFIFGNQSSASAMKKRWKRNQ